jgi:hypothetical protein
MGNFPRGRARCPEAGVAGAKYSDFDDWSHSGAVRTPRPANPARYLLFNVLRWLICARRNE